MTPLTGDRREVERALLQALSGRIEPPPVSATYRLGLMVVAFAMVLLPATYLALVAGVGYGLYWHAVENLSMLSGRGGMKARVFGYLAPLIAGGTLLLFMIKPLFVRQARPPPSRELGPEEEPLLFTFVQRLCQVVGAPSPDIIRADCSVNAAAGHLGLVSLSGGRLELTIGLPLVAGLTLRQFAGVLAHEFGHFSQGAGMRVSQLIRRVNGWFYRLVYGRDAWDEHLAAWSRSDATGYITLLGGLARLCVWLSRRVLWVLMFIGHVLSCFLMRQMELDADGYEVRLAGSGTFEQTALRLRELNAAGSGAYARLGDAWREKRLAENLPALILAEAAALPKDAVAHLRADVDQEQTGIFDTHPCDRERIERARALAREGLFHFEGSATLLFRDFEALAKEATVHHYGEELGPEVAQASLVSTEALVGVQRRHEEGEAALERFGQGILTPSHPVFPGLSALPEPAEPQAAMARVLAARKRFEEALGPARAANEQRGRSKVMARNAALGGWVIDAGVKPDAKELELPAPTAAGVAQAQQRAQELQAASDPPLAALREAACERLVACLSALAVPEVAASVDAGRRQEIERCLATLAAIESAQPAVVGVTESFLSLHGSLAYFSERSSEEKLSAVVLGRLPAMHAALGQAKERLGSAPYPFEHGLSATSIAAQAIPHLPDPRNVGDVHEAGMRAIKELFTLYARTLGRLALLVETVEGAAGLPPLPAPVEEKPAAEA